MFRRWLSLGLVLGFVAMLPVDKTYGVELRDYLPAEVSYDEGIPKPASVLGFEVGQWHARHDQLVRYMEALASSSNRVSLSIQGRTHEGRLLALLTITSPTNHQRLEEIRRRHVERPEEEDGPVVVWLGYSIHGDEASGSNASMLTAYHLAAARGSEMERLLDRSVILIDPSLNPDGMGRFAQWANGHRGRQPAAATLHREHQQVWPGGRTNHYWFDLNRDWLLQQHPESQARLRTLREWRPHLLGDYHEMGSDRTYFFQPGVPQRVNPLSPPSNLELTRRIATYHAAALNKDKSLYFSEESFDDFYPGKGSTYPDLTGGIGVLFEQGSARGHRHETPYGVRDFSEGVKNHFLTSLSMVKAADELRDDLRAYQRHFFASASSEARSDPQGGWVFSTSGDPARSYHLRQLLARHGLQVHALSRDLEVEGQSFEASSALLVPADQEGYRLAKSLFEIRKEFADSTFYDVSTWNLPLAFGARWAALPRKTFATLSLGEPLAPPKATPGAFSSANAGSTYAFLIEGSNYYVHRTAYRLLAAGFRPMVATRPFEAEVETETNGKNEVRAFDYGTLVIPAEPSSDGGALVALLSTSAAKDSLDIHRASTGLTPSGIDLGSPNLKPLRQPKPLLLVGSGISPYEAGEVWHLLDYRFGVELPLVEITKLETLDLNAFSHLLLVDGDYKALNEKVVAKVHTWIEGGGIVIANKRAALWAEKNLQAPEKNPSLTNPPGPTTAVAAEADGTQAPRTPYAEFEAQRQAQRISGAAFEVELDLSHPLAFGYQQTRLPVFRNSNKVLTASSNPFENVFFYSSSPQLAGFSSPENIEKIASTPSAVVRRQGKGAVIHFADNLNFRGFWYGTNKLYLNALFYGHAIQETPPREKWN